MMLLLFRFFDAASDAWTKASSNMRVYQNARAALDLIEQDLKAMLLSDEAGAEVGMHEYAVATPDADGERITFVAAVGEDDAYTSELVEVTYRKQASALQRSEVGDDAGGNWDFFGNSGSWYTSGASAWENVVGGIEEFEVSVEPSAANPQYVRIRIVAYDEIIDPARRADLFEQSRRPFARTIYLRTR
jgi:hypothetical protein